MHEIQPSLFDIVFKAENIPPFGIKVYYVKVKNNPSEAKVKSNTLKATESVYVGTPVSISIFQSTSFVLL